MAFLKFMLAEYEGVDKTSAWLGEGSFAVTSLQFWNMLLASLLFIYYNLCDC